MNLGDPFETPVVLILFNRPHRVRELIQTLSIVRPKRILAIADGPRAAHPTDVVACRLARSVLDEVDWPCSIEREFSATNLGCDHRIVSGLDWVFSQVDRAIVLEDDILPHPSFLPWAAAMLNRFGRDPTVGFISGRNPLGYWGKSDQDHIRANTGSILGWAATAQAWQRIQRYDLTGDPLQAVTEVGRLIQEPLLAAHRAIALRMFRRGELAAWDTIFDLRAGMAGLHAICSPVNLTRHTGIGSDATHTHTMLADDLGALIQAHESRPIQPSPIHQSPDSGFDRATMMVQLLTRCRNPTMAVRLARLVRHGTQLPLDGAARHHLAPFIHATESLRLLDHLAAQGLSSPLFAQLLDAIRRQATEYVPVL
ncbi:putative Methyltransferase FkbM [Gammaproteobacteria bacterium]